VRVASLRGALLPSGVRTPPAAGVMRALILGAEGLLGRDLIAVMEHRGWEVRGLGRSEVDVTDRKRVEEVVGAWGRGWIVNLAAYTDVDGAEGSPDAAFAVNRDGAGIVARAARKAGTRLLHLSTDYVFDGRRSVPYRPDDLPSPLNVYGRSKLEGEEAVAGYGSRPLTVRTSWLYGAGGRDFLDAVLERGRKGEPVKVVSDQRSRPTWARSLASTLSVLMERDAAGVLHAGDGGDASWWELATEAFRLAGLPEGPEAVDSGRFRTAARRPRYSVLDISDTERIVGTPPAHWKESLAGYMGDQDDSPRRGDEPAPTTPDAEPPR